MPEKDDKQSVHHQHDKGYKQLLSNKKTFYNLIKDFVKEEWVNEINEIDLILVNKSYILQDFREKEADIVYMLKIGEENIIFYILLELQSTVDYLMPFRVLLYMVEIWREFYNNTPEKERVRKDFRLPAVIPAVLYNGEENWTSILNFKEMLTGYKIFGDNLLDFRYILFDVNRYSEEELFQMAGLLSSVFFLDQKSDPPELMRRLRKLARILRNMKPDEFRQIIVWLKNLIKPRVPEYMREEIDIILNENAPWEVDVMISNIGITLVEIQSKAAIDGKNEGMIEGKIEQSRNFMQKLLYRKFGLEASKLQPQLDQLNNLEVLTNIFEKLLGVSTWDEAVALINDGIRSLPKDEEKK